MAIPIKVYKATAIARPLSQKRLSRIAQESAAARYLSAQLSQQASQMRPSSTPSIPKSQKDGSNGQDNSGQTGLTYGVQMQKKYFVKDDLEMVEGGIEGAEPLPEGAESTFDKAYKLGATLVAVNEELQKPMDTKTGLEILQFTNRKLYRRHFHMGETWLVFGSDDNFKAQIQISSMIKAMSRQDKYAIVRYIRTSGSEPKVNLKERKKGEG
jgi:ATP-dependent DNA helicase 2 subunit 2